MTTTPSRKLRRATSMAGANFGYLFRGALEEDNVSCLWDTNTTTDIMQYAVPATIASSFLSIAGSILIIFTFVMWKDVRKSVARRILLFLAIADLLGALGYFCGGIFTYIWKENITMCRIQSFWTTYFPVVSFFWTAYLAIYFVVALVLKKPNWTNKLMVPFHLTAWTIPLVICVVFTIMDYLGPNPTHNTNNTILRSQVAVGWCYVSSGIFENVTDDIGFFIYRMHIYFFVEAVSGKMWEMLAYCVVIVSYCLIVCSNRCKCCKYDPSMQPQSPENSLEGASSYYTKQRIAEAMASVDIKLVLVPVIFVFLRCWGTIRYFIFMSSACSQPCLDSETQTYWLQVNDNCLANNPGLVMLQALCDPLQGFGNAILFVFFSRVLLHRLWSCTCGVFQRLMYYITYPCTQRCLSTPQTPMDTDARSIQSTESTDLLRVTYSPALKRRPLNGDDKKGFSNAHQQLDYGSMQWNPLLNSKENGSLH